MGESWAQKRLGFQRAWGLTMGQGVTTAVVDSGADSGHPMLSGRVPDALDLTGTGKRDCVGHGTGVAALIGGRDLSAGEVPLSGVAPAVRLLIVKQQNADRDDGGGDRLPTAIRKAADAGAQVINVSIRTVPSPALLAAVHYAQGKDAVIVAAAGNAKKKNGDDGPAYPASYPGVLSVASLGTGGGRVESSSLQSRVDLGAPGQGVPVAWTGGGYKAGAEGTSYAAAFVSGVASLVRSYRPRLDQKQVVQRILATAEGNVGAGTGRGMVNPVQAVTAVVPDENAAPAMAPRPSASPARLAAPVPVDGRTRGISITVAAGALGTAGVAALAGVVVPLGRRRGWRPGRVVLSERPIEDDPVPEGPDRGTIGAPN
ncbi:S8 family serine peptidase [Actinomadura xylanilytica]|uniref:S8 family serine peptidase n=1 Tax=Actinomadura xylanilytica TaxID=887459 RepID=UPI00255AD330|nr:S8 family serine peptidase [Actinomadura xylanilytica]MDL4772612.1 S8 family serine peptidase [Actinomadura xylanilytica]